MKKHRTASIVAAGAMVLTTGSAGAVPRTPPEHRRPPEQTYLTYPEWFLVFSPAEYAAFVKEGSPSAFPFFGHIRQFWQGYSAVWRATRGRYPFNAGYHLMVFVIGTSTTLEYGLRGTYEGIFGRLAELTRTHGPTKEELLSARIAQEYVDFIRVSPWYDFDFKSCLRRLWSETGATGPDMIRKWERKYALTSEYAAKAAYGFMIRKATKATYEEPLPVTAAVIDRLPREPVEGLTVVKSLDDGSVLVTLPRYEAFMRLASRLAQDGVVFREIAGNDGEIAVSVLASGGGGAAAGTRVLLKQPILTRPGTERLVVSVPVSALGSTLNRFSRPPFELEHVYDY